MVAAQLHRRRRRIALQRAVDPEGLLPVRLARITAGAEVPLPIRIVTRNANLTDHQGNLWELDRYYSGGRQISDGEIVSGDSTLNSAREGVRSLGTP